MKIQLWFGGLTRLWFCSLWFCSGAGQGVRVVPGQGEEAAERSGSHGRSARPPGVAEHGAQGEKRAARQQGPPAAGEQARNNLCFSSNTD